MKGVALLLASNCAHRAVSCECMISAKLSEGASVNVPCIRSHLEGNSNEPNWDTIGIRHPKSGEAPCSPNVIGARMGEGGASIMSSRWFMKPA